MKHPLVKSRLLIATLPISLVMETTAQYAGWQHAGSIFILTTAESAT